MYLYNQCKIKFNDTELDGIIESLNYTYRNVQSEFASLCHYFAKLKDYFKSKGKYYLVSGHIHNESSKYTYLDIIKNFGYEEKTVNKFVQCNAKFVYMDNFEGSSIPRLEDEFVNFSAGKLFELLPLSKEIIIQEIKKGVLKPEMTQKEIREFVKYLKGKTKDTNQVLEEDEESDEDISESFDVDNEYNFEYFSKQSKEKLIDISWKLYCMYKKKLSTKKK